MPTTSARKDFVPFALQFFLQQTYADKELIILDDSNGEIEILIPKNEQIKYIHHPLPFNSLGAKRNYACSLAIGEIILHWDDDDWYAPDWIMQQVNFISDIQADICGLDKVYFFDAVKNKSWQYQYDMEKPWVTGATMAYRKQVWLQNPFKEKNVGEDNDFVWTAKGKVAASTYTKGFVSFIHNNNTSPKYTNDSQWKNIDVKVIREILKEDFRF